MKAIIYGDWIFIDGGETAIGQEPLRASSTVLPFSLLPGELLTTAYP